MVLNAGWTLESPEERLWIKMISVRALLQNNLTRISGGGTSFLLVLAQPHKTDAIIPVFQMRKLSIRDGKNFSITHLTRVGTRLVPKWLSNICCFCLVSSIASFNDLWGSTTQSPHSAKLQAGWYQTQRPIHLHTQLQRSTLACQAEQPQTLTVSELSTVPLHLGTTTRMTVFSWEPEG